jgi:hypothetical protein
MKLTCGQCGQEKEDFEFQHHGKTKTGFSKRCRLCIETNPTPALSAELSLRQATYRETNRARIRESVKKCNASVKAEVFDHYGRACACCGEDREEFLAIDHIDGGGRTHRKRIRMMIYFWLRKNGFPEGFRTLCHNCNMSLGRRGYCPHQTEGTSRLTFPTVIGE